MRDRQSVSQTDERQTDRQRDSVSVQTQTEVSDRLLQSVLLAPPTIRLSARVSTHSLICLPVSFLSHSLSLCVEEPTVLQRLPLLVMKQLYTPS